MARVVPLVAIGLGLRILAAGPGTYDGTPIAASVGAIENSSTTRNPGGAAQTDRAPSLIELRMEGSIG